MSIITIRNEKNIDQLIAKRFTGLSATEVMRMRAATLKANPHLREGGELKPGTVVVLPQAMKPPVKPAASRDVTQSDAAEGLAEALKTYAPQLTGALEKAREELDQSAKLLKSAAFKKAPGAESKEAASLAKALEGALKREIEANGDARASLSKEIDVLLKDLSELTKKLA